MRIRTLALLPAFLSFVLGLLDSAEVIAPPELRAEMVDWLERISRGAA